MPVSVSFCTPASGCGARDAEIGDERVSAGEQNVLGLDVAVDDALLVRIAKRVVHLEGDRDRVFDGQHSLAIQAIAQRLALHERHHIVEQIAGDARVEQPEDVGMLQLRGESDLALEPLAAERRGELRHEHLDRDFAIVLDVVREIDGGHSATTKLADNIVLTLERSLQPGQDVRCCGLDVERIGQGGLRRGERLNKLASA